MKIQDLTRRGGEALPLPLNRAPLLLARGAGATFTANVRFDLDAVRAAA